MDVSPDLENKLLDSCWTGPTIWGVQARQSNICTQGGCTCENSSGTSSHGEQGHSGRTSDGACENSSHWNLIAWRGTRTEKGFKKEVPVDSGLKMGSGSLTGHGVEGLGPGMPAYSLKYSSILITSSKLDRLECSDAARPNWKPESRMAHASRGSLLPTFSMVSFLAEAQMARQNAILLMKSARLYTRLSESSSTPPSKYPKKYPSG